MQLDLTNLKRETYLSLARFGHTLDNVEHITLYGVGVTLDDFLDFAEGFDYDSGYGTEHVPPFVLKMDDGSWYERGEYDGSEWWAHRQSPTAPSEFAGIASILKDSDRSWYFPMAFDRARDCESFAIEQTEYEDFLADLAEYEAALHEECMNDLYDEIEGDLDRPTCPNKGDWHDGKGKYAHKSRCTREVHDESRYGTFERWATKHNSRCWKDQRSTGRGKRDHQYRTIAIA